MGKTLTFRLPQGWTEYLDGKVKASIDGEPAKPATQPEFSRMQQLREQARATPRQVNRGGIYGRVPRITPKMPRIMR